MLLSLRRHDAIDGRRGLLGPYRRCQLASSCCATPMNLISFGDAQGAKAAAHLTSESVKEWAAAALAARPIAGLSPGVDMMVSEVKCGEPGCPPREVVISFFEPGNPLKVQIGKALADVLREDVVHAVGGLGGGEPSCSGDHARGGREVDVEVVKVLSQDERIAAARASAIDIDQLAAHAAPLKLPNMGTLVVTPYKKAVAVTGDTKNVKDILKALGGRWNSGLTAWLFPGSRKDEVVAGLREAGTTVNVGEAAAPPPAAGAVRPAAAQQHVSMSPDPDVDARRIRRSVPGEGAAAPAAAPAAAMAAAMAAVPAAAAAGTLLVAPYKKAVAVTGDTKAFMATLKELRGSWNRSLTAWLFQGSRKDAVVAGLRAAGATVTVAVAEPASAAAAATAAAAPAGLKTEGRPATRPSTGGNVGPKVTISVEPYKKKALLVKGDTKPIKESLKQLGGRWNKMAGGWVFGGSQVCAHTFRSPRPVLFQAGRWANLFQCVAGRAPRSWMRWMHARRSPSVWLRGCVRRHSSSVGSSARRWRRRSQPAASGRRRSVATARSWWAKMTRTRRTGSVSTHAGVTRNWRTMGLMRRTLSRAAGRGAESRMKSLVRTTLVEWRVGAGKHLTGMRVCCVSEHEESVLCREP